MDERPTHLDLFTGIGGFALAAKWTGFRTIGFCEIDKFCQKVLAKNFLNNSDTGRWQRENGQIQAGRDIAICPDIRELDGRDFYGVTIITGGFPCQPFSVAGNRRGAADDRAIWPEMFRVIDEARPAWVLGENVPGIIQMELDNVLSDLERIGYATRTFVVPACAVDARHRRDRVFIVGRRLESDTECRNGEESELRQRSVQTSGREAPSGFSHEDPDGERRWLSEPDVGGNFDGLSRQLDETGLSYEAKTRATEIMRMVWCDDVSEAFQWNPGRFSGVSETEVLLAFLCEFQEESDSCRTEVQGRETARRILRNLWHAIESSRSPYQRQYRRQFAREYSDALRKLPRETSSLYPQAWADSCWEDGLPRVAHGIKDRVNRLKGLGNAIVPQVAYEILREIRKQITP